MIGGAVGSLGNVSGELESTVGVLEDLSSGKAAAVLEVTGFEGLLELAKEFTDDPVPPGGTVTLEFTVTNKSRVDSATGLTFSDTIDPLGTLTGLAPSGPLPTDPCGDGSMPLSTLSFSSGVLTLTDGKLPPEGSCTFSVELDVPPGAAPMTYSNSAGPVSGDVGGEPETGNVTGDLLFVVSFPLLTKEFTDDPVGAGGTVTLEFTITNPEGMSVMTDIEFVDELTDAALAGGEASGGFLPFPVSVTIPPGDPCGVLSSLALVFIDDDRQGLSLTGGGLTAGGTMGDSCTFSVTIDIPAGLAAGTYTNTTEEISGVLDDLAGSPTVTGPPASGDLVVGAAPQLSKEFTDDPVAPGGTVTLEFTLTHDPPGLPPPPLPDATLIAFSDDLGDTLAGLTLTSVVTNDCGGAVAGTGTDMFSYSGGTLTAGATCTIELELTVPTMVSGTFENETSDVSAVVAGVTARERRRERRSRGQRSALQQGLHRRSGHPRRHRDPRFHPRQRGRGRRHRHHVQRQLGCLRGRPSGYDGARPADQRLRRHPRRSHARARAYLRGLLRRLRADGGPAVQLPRHRPGAARDPRRHLHQYDQRHPFQPRDR